MSVHEVHEELTLRIERLAASGDGVAHDAGGRVVFVPASCPGDRVRVRITERRRAFARAELVEVLKPGPTRVTPPCPYVGECGGCSWQHLSYTQQCHAKAQRVRDAFARIAGVNTLGARRVPFAFHECPAPFGYRARARLGFRDGVVGYRRARSHTLCAVSSCAVLTPELDATLAELAAHPPAGRGELTLMAGDDDSGVSVSGDAGHANAVGDASAGHANAVNGARGNPVHHNAVSGARAKAPAADADGDHAVHHNATLRRARGNPVHHNAVSGARADHAIVLHVDGARVRVSAGGFCQANAPLRETLARAVFDAAGEGARVLELFAGAGYFTLGLARRFQKVLVVEAQGRATRDLRANLKAAGATHVEVATARAELELDGERARAFAPEVVVLDPPRNGLTESACERLAELAPARIVYLACDPATQARDVRRLLTRGYRLQTLTAFDLFPQTPHVESLALLLR